MNLQDLFFPALAGALGSGIPVFIWELIRAATRKKSIIEKLPKEIENIKTVISELMEETIVQTDCLQATLESLKGNCNGNVDSALLSIVKIKESRNNFYRKHILGDIIE